MYANWKYRSSMQSEISGIKFSLLLPFSESSRFSFRQQPEKKIRKVLKINKYVLNRVSHKCVKRVSSSLQSLWDSQIHFLISDIGIMTFGHLLPACKSVNFIRLEPCEVIRVSQWHFVDFFMSCENFHRMEWNLLFRKSCLPKISHLHQM